MNVGEWQLLHAALGGNPGAADALAELRQLRAENAELRQRVRELEALTERGEYAACVLRLDGVPMDYEVTPQGFAVARVRLPNG